MSSTDEVTALLRRAGYKVTAQRVLIVEAVRDAGGHVSAADIAERVHARFPSVDLSTVYRTLDMLKQVGLVSVTDLGAGDMLFEWRTNEPHHHLVCVRCNQQYDLNHTYLQPLAERLDEEFGFSATLDHFAIFGICRDCRMEQTHGHPA